MMLKKELEQVLRNQVHDKNLREELRKSSLKYLDTLKEGIKDKEGKIKYKWEDFQNLFLAAAFIERDNKEDIGE